MSSDNNSDSKKETVKRKYPTISAVLEDGSLLELVHNRERHETAFALWRNGKVTLTTSVNGLRGRRLVPYSADNNLIKYGVVLFPERAEEYGSDQQLVRELRAFVHRYIDVPIRFEHMAVYYVLLSWLYDRFNELPYLRLRGDYGSGKTRFLLTVGSLCYRPIFASGASSISPFFRILHSFGGTLVIDEGDFRFSDEKADVIKLLNGGHARGIPILKSDTGKSGEFDPRAFNIFGPKLVATRGVYKDRALESRCITHETGGRNLRKDVPLNLPSTFHEEATALRNKLLMYRFRHFAQAGHIGEVVDPSIEPRLNQVFSPLLSIIEDQAVRKALRDLAREHHKDLTADRGMDIEAHVLSVIQSLTATSRKPNLFIKDITKGFLERYGKETEHAVTNQWIGMTVRRKLQLRTYKSHGNYCVPPSERPKLERLYERYGLTGDSTRAGDAGERSREAA